MDPLRGRVFVKQPWALARVAPPVAERLFCEIGGAGVVSQEKGEVDGKVLAFGELLMSLARDLDRFLPAILIDRDSRPAPGTPRSGSTAFPGCELAPSTPP